MLSEAALLALKQAGESERVELKPSTAQGQAIRRAICSFANDLTGGGEPGLILIGLEDDGGCAELGDLDAVQQKVANWAHGGDILPLPDVEIYRRDLEDCPIVVAEVRPHEEPPVRYQGQAWVRVGSANRRATPEQERRLTERRRGGDRPFDHRPAAGTCLDDLDIDYFQREYLPNAVSAEVLEENHRTTGDQLRSLRLITNDEPNHGAILVLGYDPAAHIPGAYVQRFGFGVPLARRHLRENGNPEPRFDFEATYVAVTVGAAR